MAVLGIRLTQEQILEQLQLMELDKPLSDMSEKELKQSFIKAEGQVAMQTEAYLKLPDERKKKLKNYFEKRDCNGSCILPSFLEAMRNLQPLKAMEAA